MLVPAEEKASLTGERVKAIWLIHLTIFIFIAQSDKPSEAQCSVAFWPIKVQSFESAGIFLPIVTSHPSYQTKFAKLIWPLTKNKSQSVGPVKSSMIIDQLASADSALWPSRETFTRLILFSPISHSPLVMFSPRWTMADGLSLHIF